jgi:drug/metabolite transporter (DMT)-like permease
VNTPSARADRLDASQLAPGTLYTLLAAMGFAAVSILTSLALATGTTLSNVMAWRYVLAAVVLTTYVGSQNYKRIPPREMMRFVVIGGFGQALMVWLALSSLEYIPAATLAFLFYTYPAWVALFQAVRGAEALDRRRAAALVLSFAGIGVMVGMPGGDGGVDWRGVGLALSAALVYGAFIPVMRILQKDHPVAPTSAYSKVGAALAFLLLSVVDQSFTYRISVEAWGIILALTLVSTVLPSVFFLMGLIRLGPVRTAIVSTVEPFLTALLGVIVLGQALTMTTLVGGALIIAAVVLLQFRRDRVA